MYCGIEGVKNCECARQCRADESKYHMYKPRWSCFEYNDVPMEKQLSQVPLPGAKVTWYKTLHKREGVERDPAKKSRRLAPPGAEWVNAKLCPGHCNERGMCYRRGQNSPECRCYWGYFGPDCSNQREDSCFHACSGHGQCIGGFCKCDPGHWGIDCSSNLCPKEEPYRGPPANKPFKIFVYELPTRIAYRSTALACVRACCLSSMGLRRPGCTPQVPLVVGWVLTRVFGRSEIDVNSGQQYHDAIYIAYKLFLKQLLHDCSVRTRDPAEADLFYVPAFAYGWSSNTGSAEPQLARVIEHLKKTSPWFRRNKGRDHMVFMPHDRGMCQRYWPHSDTVMMMGFWGAQKPGTREQMQHGYGGEDRKLHQATMFLKGCYDPLKDVVVPPYNIQYKKQAQLYYADWKLPGPDGKGGVWGKGAEGRRHTFMFAGGLRPVLQYSQGIRQEVFKHLKHTPGFEVAERLPNAMQSMMQSKYCGVFTGHGWGIRIVQVSANGCIPVVIQDWVTQPLEEVVPFWSFALRFSRQQIKDLPRLLGEIPESRLRSMQMQQFRYHQVFSWDADTGKAYEYTLQLLRRKAEHRSWHRALPEKPSLRSGGSARGKKAARDDSEQGKRKSRAVPAVPGRSPRKGSSRAARTSRMPSGAGLVHFPKH
mmetsp:Transcript_66343/g.209707  ORF Transcript_66343/g.209707 Transcript_66343/m.209707 type:complete len:649 (-) Transcript_66343:441-2387(-)